MPNNTSQSTYLALTIGPIYRTLGQARRVRQLWGASYMFSLLMKKIIQEVDRESLFFERLLPQYDAQAEYKNGVGLFPDRLYLRVKKDRIDAASVKLNECLNKAVSELVSSSKIPSLHTVVSEYLQTYSLQTDIDDGENYIGTLNQLLDGVELAQQAGEPVMFQLTEFLESALSTFYKQAFTNSRKQFESLTEIGASDLARNVPDYDDFIKRYRGKIGTAAEEDFFAMLKKETPQISPYLKQYHKYIAIVHADGDYVGKTLNTIGHDDQLLDTFSRQLFRFAIDATNSIDEWGGMPIYAGGDDLLFIAPVMSENQTIFHLLNSLATLFENTVTRAGSWKPTLSFGVNITYYKFPLAEGLEGSRDLLFHKAKLYKNKNCIAFRIQKHSGSDFSAILPNPMNRENLHWRQLLDSAHTSDDQRFFSSVMYTLEEYQSVLEILLADEERLGYFFDNHFNESVHRKPEGQARLSAITGLLKGASEGVNESALDTTFSALRFIQFIQSDFQS